MARKYDTLAPVPEWINDVTASLPPLAKIKEAASVLRVSVRQVQREIARGRLGALRASETGSSRTLIPRRAIAKYLEAMAVQP